VRAATITFGRGITVLHGPNELGKSTLVEAIHAALLVPTKSQTGNDYITWGGSSPACVTLNFEHEGKLWRVSKRFGRRSEAKLESCELGSQRFREVVNGRGVEGKVRELLSWGIVPPGGRGAAPKAESFLLTALLGRQGEAQAIFGTSLDHDRDDTGKSLVTRALGALDNDPLVSRMLDSLRSRVAAVFNANGGLRTAADSPLARLQQHLRSQREVLERLQADEVRGSGIQADVVRLQDHRQRLLGELETAEAGRMAAAEYAERVRAKATLQVHIDEIRGQLAQADTWAAELAALDERLTAGKSNLDVLKRAEEAAASGLASVRVKRETAAEELARATEAADQSQRVNDAIVAQRQAELAMAKAAAETRLSDVAAAEQLVAESARLEQQCGEATAARDSAVAATIEAARTLEHATARAALEELLSREQTAARAFAQSTGAQQREQAAREQLDAAAAAIADAERRRDGGELELQSPDINDADAEMLVLQAVESHIRIARLRTEVEALEAASQRARTLRTSAQARRSEASDIDRSVASRALPTREQIASWRELDHALKTDSTQVPVQSSPLIPVVLAAVATFAGVFIGIRLGTGWSVPVALLAGLVAAAMAGGLTWVSLHGRVRVQSAEHEHRERRRDRWAREVEPSLRAAGLESLAAYEGAVADLERQKLEAQRLRNQADRDDLDAGNAERAAIPLESRRDELDRLERERPGADAVAVVERAQALGSDLDRVRLRLGEVRTAREAARARFRAEANAAVARAIEHRRERQAEYDAGARELAAAETTLSLARQHCNPGEVSRLEARLAEIGDAPHSTVTEASTALDAARMRQAETSTLAETLKVRLDEAQLRVARTLADLEGDLLLARQRAQGDLDDIAGRLASLETSRATSLASAAKALEDARRAQLDLEPELSGASESLDCAANVRSDAEVALATLETEAAALRGQLTAINRPAIEERLRQATSDPVFSSPVGPQLDLAAAKAEVDRLQQQLDRCTNDLNHARGQLHLIAGHVGTERLSQQQEAVTLAHAEVLERERVERAALRLLREIESAEAERSTHLGRTLAGPVTDAFQSLTRGRYGSIALAPDLRTEHVEAEGGARPVELVSVGTREQLATLLRLAVAGYLKTAIVLDDQLVHSDSWRLEWFKRCLRESSRTHGHQVIVFTCRPGDYLASDGADDGVTAIDLTAFVS
jgi:hypothetical protein